VSGLFTAVEHTGCMRLQRKACYDRDLAHGLTENQWKKRPLWEGRILLHDLQILVLKNNQCQAGCRTWFKNMNSGQQWKDEMIV
jgi:hypothetical protein